MLIIFAPEMMNFNIKNEAEQVTIDIFGEIGEDWFGEGITMQSVRDQLTEAKGKSIELRVSSLGGQVDHALTIHDILKMHDKPVTARILGATASSGTIIAMGAHSVEMSENALFLVHNASTFGVGNADELRETADELDLWDSKIADVYKTKTGKRKSQILSLMGQARWIDSKEAKDFGFIDKSFKPSEVTNMISPEKQKELLEKYNAQKFNTMDKKEFTGLNKVLNVEGLILSDDGSFLNKEQLTLIVDEITGNETQIETLTGERQTALDRVTELETKGGEHETETKGLQDAINNALTMFNEFLGTKFESLQDITVEDESPLKSLKTSAEKVVGLESEIAEMKSNGLKLDKGEPNLVKKDKPEDKVRAKQVSQVDKQMDKYTRKG